MESTVLFRLRELMGEMGAGVVGFSPILSRFSSGMATANGDDEAGDEGDVVDLGDCGCSS